MKNMSPRKKSDPIDSLITPNNSSPTPIKDTNPIMINILSLIAK